MIVRLVREVEESGTNGPSNGMWAIQNAFRWCGMPDWFRIGGQPSKDELPWFWCWKDREEALAWAEVGRPFIHGPCIFFHKNTPLSLPAEKVLADAKSCRLILTDGPQWYVDLIRANLGPDCRPEIVSVPFPIEPKPGPPLPIEHDVLIYAKAGFHENTVDKLTSIYPKALVLRYGTHDRKQLWNLARRSGVCIYLSAVDRGPLGLAEILLAGCPTVGVPHGAPWIESGKTGCFADDLTAASLVRAVDQLLSWGIRREEVRAHAAERFSTSRIVATFLSALDSARLSV